MYTKHCAGLHDYVRNLTLRFVWVPCHVSRRQHGRVFPDSVASLSQNFFPHLANVTATVRGLAVFDLAAIFTV